MLRYCLFRCVGLAVLLSMVLSAGMAWGYEKQNDYADILKVVFVPLASDGTLLGFENSRIFVYRIKADEEGDLYSLTISLITEILISKPSISD